jgi:hypothetical protein
MLISYLCDIAETNQVHPTAFCSSKKASRYLQAVTDPDGLLSIHQYTMYQNGIFRSAHCSDIHCSDLHFPAPLMPSQRPPSYVHSPPCDYVHSHDFPSHLPFLIALHLSSPPISYITSHTAQLQNTHTHTHTTRSPITSHTTHYQTQLCSSHQAHTHQHQQ